MAHDHMPTYGSVTKAAEAVGPQLGISGNTLRRWVVQADVDDDGFRESPGLAGGWWRCARSKGVRNRGSTSSASVE